MMHRKEISADGFIMRDEDGDDKWRRGGRGRVMIVQYAFMCMELDLLLQKHSVKV